MVYRTIQDWNARGKLVIRGSRALARTNRGEALFGVNQVENKPRIKSTRVVVTYY